MNVRYRVELSQAERGELTAMLSKGRRAARKLKRAQILLAADAGCSDEEIARTVAVTGSTVYRTKRRFVEGNLERALSEDPRPGAERKLTGKEEALLVATACANPPKGRGAPAGRWNCWPTLWSSSPSTRACRGKRCGGGWPKTGSSHGAGICVYVVYSEDRRRICRPHGIRARPLCRSARSKAPVICFDESPVQLIGEVRQPIPADRAL